MIPSAQRHQTHRDFLDLEPLVHVGRDCQPVIFANQFLSLVSLCPSNFCPSWLKPQASGVRTSRQQQNEPRTQHFFQKFLWPERAQRFFFGKECERSVRLGIVGLPEGKGGRIGKNPVFGPNFKNSNERGWICLKSFSVFGFGAIT